jgi:glucan phosphoethanolaminetransferase (alkaline phosphatase superfamily)
MIAVGFWVLASTFSAGLESLNESGFVKQDTVSQNRDTMSYATIAVPLVIVLEIVVLILVFVMKPRQVKPIGIFLLAVSVVVLISTSWYGVLPFALFLPAGMLALKYKLTRVDEPEVLYRSDGTPLGDRITDNKYRNPTQRRVYGRLQ